VACATPSRLFVGYLNVCHLHIAGVIKLSEQGDVHVVGCTARRLIVYLINPKPDPAGVWRSKRPSKGTARARSRGLGAALTFSRDFRGFAGSPWGKKSMAVLFEPVPRNCAIVFALVGLSSTCACKIDWGRFIVSTGIYIGSRSRHSSVDHFVLKLTLLSSFRLPPQDAPSTRPSYDPRSRRMLRGARSVQYATGQLQLHPTPWFRATATLWGMAWAPRNFELLRLFLLQVFF